MDHVCSLRRKDSPANPFNEDTHRLDHTREQYHYLCQFTEGYTNVIEETHGIHYIAHVSRSVKHTCTCIVQCLNQLGELIVKFPFKFDVHKYYHCDRE